MYVDRVSIPEKNVPLLPSTIGNKNQEKTYSPILSSKLYVIIHWYTDYVKTIKRVSKSYIKNTHTHNLNIIHVIIINFFENFAQFPPHKYRHRNDDLYIRKSLQKTALYRLIKIIMRRGQWVEINEWKQKQMVWILILVLNRKH